MLSRLGEVFDAAESKIAAEIIGRYHGAIPDAQLLEEIGLAIAIHRRTRRQQT